MAVKNKDFRLEKIFNAVVKMKRNSDCEPVSLVGIEQAKAKLEKKKSEMLALVLFTVVACFLTLIITVKL